MTKEYDLNTIEGQWAFYLAATFDLNESDPTSQELRDHLHHAFMAGAVVATAMMGRFSRMGDEAASYRLITTLRSFCSDSKEPIH